MDEWRIIIDNLDFEYVSSWNGYNQFRQQIIAIIIFSGVDNRMSDLLQYI